MKKLVFMFAAIVAVSFASCGGNTKNAECTDSCAADTCVKACEVVEDSCCGGDSCKNDTCKNDTCKGDTCVKA